MDQHRTLEIRPGRRARRRTERRKRFRQRFMASAALAFLAAMLVLLFAQPMEPPMVTATLPDKPTEEEEVVHDEGFELGRERVLAPVAAGKPSGGAQTPVDGRSRLGEGGSTGEPPPANSAIPPAPVAEPPRTPAGGGVAATPSADDIDDEPPPPPVTTSPVAVDEEASRPPIDLPADAVCWDGHRYDESRQECVREEEPEPADKAEDAEEVAEEQTEEEQPEEETEEPSRGLGGVGKDGEVSR